MRPSPPRVPSLLALPSAQTQGWADHGRLSADIFEALVACNAHVKTDFKRGDMRYDFVGKSGARGNLTALVRGAQRMCPKTWPVVMYLVDRVSRTDIPVTQRTAVRLVAAATYLVLSTEGNGFAVKLAHLASLHVTALERLGEQMVALLGDDTRELEWDALLGMHEIGWLRTELPRRARELQREFARRRIAGEEAAAGLDPVHMALSPRTHSPRHGLTRSNCNALCLPPPALRQNSGNSSMISLDGIGLAFSQASSSCSSLLGDDEQAAGERLRRRNSSVLNIRHITAAQRYLSAVDSDDEE